MTIRPQMDVARAAALDDVVRAWIERADEYSRWRMAQTLGAMGYLPSRALGEMQKHAPRKDPVPA